MRPVAIEEARSRFRLGDIAERTGIYVPRSGGSVMSDARFRLIDTSIPRRLYACIWTTAYGTASAAPPVVTWSSGCGRRRESAGPRRYDSLIRAVR